LVVATDHEEIVRKVKEEGGEVRLTPPELPSGSDRVAWLTQELEGEGNQFDLVVNIQGDEPFLPGEAIDRAVQRLEREPEGDMATLAVPAASEAAEDPNVVKVVVDGEGWALYFSRARIPYPWAGGEVPLQHVGLYAYRRPYLARFVTLAPSGLEKAEGLEQLRALQDGARIRVEIGNWPVLGIDTPQDLARAEARLQAR